MTEDFPRPAARPKYSVLDKGMIEENGFESFQDWKKSLSDFLTKLEKTNDKNQLVQRLLFELKLLIVG